MENIVRTIRAYYPVSDEALAALTHGFEKQVFPAKTLIIRAGQFDRQVHFIEKGMTRSYTLHDGKEITTWFSMEGDVACGSWDLYRNKAGFEYVETLEETLVYSISMYLQPIITQYFIDNKSEIWLLFLIAHSKR